MSEHDHGLEGMEGKGMIVMGSFDKEADEFAVLLCLDGAHITVQLPLDRPMALVRLMQFSSVLAKTVLHVLIESSLGEEVDLIKVLPGIAELFSESQQIEAMDDEEFDKLMKTLFLDEKE